MAQQKSSLLWLWILLGVGAVGFLVVVMGVVAVGAIFWMRPSPAKPNAPVASQAEPAIHSSVPGPSSVAGPPAAKIDQEKEEVIQLVKQHAEDPADLEIVTWGEKSLRDLGPLWGGGKGYVRSVSFRCKLVGMSNPRTIQGLPGGNKLDPGGKPVMLEDATIVYDSKGKIKLMSCDKINEQWNPK
jgi:hypothetical protein